MKKRKFDDTARFIARLKRLELPGYAEACAVAAIVCETDVEWEALKVRIESLSLVPLTQAEKATIRNNRLLAQQADKQKFVESLQRVVALFSVKATEQQRFIEFLRGVVEQYKKDLESV